MIFRSCQIHLTLMACFYIEEAIIQIIPRSLPHCRVYHRSLFVLMEITIRAGHGWENPAPKVVLTGQRNMWVKLIVISRPCFYRFLSGCSGFPLPQNPNIFKIPLWSGIFDEGPQYIGKRHPAFFVCSLRTTGPYLSL